MTTTSVPKTFVYFVFSIYATVSLIQYRLQQPICQNLSADIASTLEKNEGEIKKWQSRETGNIGHTRLGTKTNKIQHRKIKDTPPPETPLKTGWTQVLAKLKLIIFRL